MLPASPMATPTRHSNRNRNPEAKPHKAVISDQIAMQMEMIATRLKRSAAMAIGTPMKA